jgi:hypothetical protein
MSLLVIFAAKHKFDFRKFFSFGLFQLRRDLTRTKETNNCRYASRGFEVAKTISVMTSGVVLTYKTEISLMQQFL